ncbi:hypothetical protein GJ496_002406 [Pomphorhynchus laevis]|nr:hypothetical protein GJ496_002406 [Pomphorhynchus laevis]
MSENESICWLDETKQVEWSFRNGDDVLEKLAALYPFRSIFDSNQANLKENLDNEVVNNHDEGNDLQGVSDRNIKADNEYSCKEIPLDKQTSQNLDLPKCASSEAMPDEYTAPEDSNENNQINQFDDLDIDDLCAKLKSLIASDICNGSKFQCVLVTNPDDDNISVVQLHSYNSEINDCYRTMNDWVSISAIGQSSLKHTYRDQWVSIYYTDTWHRAIVTKVLSQTMINVKLVDLGIFATFPLSAMHPLPDSLIKFPEQTFQCHILGLSSKQAYPGLRIDVIPMPYGFKDEIVEQPLPLRLAELDNEASRIEYDGNDDPYVGDDLLNKTLHHTLDMESSPICSRRPPLPSNRQSTLEYFFNDQLLPNIASSQQFDDFIAIENESMRLRQNSSENIETTYALLSSSDSSNTSSDVGSLYNETNGVINHVQSLFEDDRDKSDNIPSPEMPILKRKTSAVSTICCRIRSTLHRKK